MTRVAVTLGLSLALLSATPAEAARAYCEKTVAERLQRLKVDPADVKSVFYDAQRNTSEKSDRVVGILAWVRLETCEGHLVIELDRHCRIRQVYGRGECSAAGVSRDR